MNLRVITPPAAEPVSVATVKQQLRIDVADEDALLAIYIAAAREQAEGLLRRALITQTLELILDAWPSDGIVKLPRPPLQSVSSVTYLDEDGTEFTWTDYLTDVRSEPGKIHFQSVPTTSLFASGAIAVQYVAGYGNDESTIPNPILQALFMTIGHWYENREATTGNNYQVFEVPLGPKQLLLSERVDWF